MKYVRPYLIFQGQAQQAVAFYLEVFPEATLLPPPVLKGVYDVRVIILSLHGQEVMIIDELIDRSNGFPCHGFSFFIDCDDRSEFDRLTTTLASGGVYTIPPDDYGFSSRFAYLTDQFGIGWQINLA